MLIDFSHKFDTLLLEENKDFLVIEKPAGLLVHPVKSREASSPKAKFNRANVDKYTQEKTLTDFILEKYPAIKEIGQAGRNGIVHRLDRDVSGLMVITRTPKMYHHLIEQFQQRKIKKEYLALVYGHLKENKGEIDLPLARNKKGKIVAVLYRKQLKQEKQAKTGYEVKQKFIQPQKFTLLNVFLHTGRTHQIRIHLKSLGHPIVGDKEYTIKNLRLKRPLKLNRLFLHARYLGFNDLRGNWREFRKDLPTELENFLTELK